MFSLFNLNDISVEAFHQGWNLSREDFIEIHLSWSNDILSMWKYCLHLQFIWMINVLVLYQIFALCKWVFAWTGFFSSSMNDKKSTDTHITSYFTVGLFCNWLVFNAVFHLCRHYVLWLQKSRSKSCEVGIAWTYVLKQWRCYPIFFLRHDKFCCGSEAVPYLLVVSVMFDDLVEVVFISN